MMIIVKMSKEKISRILKLVFCKVDVILLNDLGFVGYCFGIRVFKYY